MNTVRTKFKKPPTIASGHSFGEKFSRIAAEVVVRPSSSPSVKNPNKVETPVWIHGKVTKRTSTRVTIDAIDIRDKQRSVTLPLAHVKREEPSGDVTKFNVPQWWAYQQKLKYSET